MTGDGVGAPPERVLLLRANLPDGKSVSVGSGTLIAPRLVLTAAHVVFDQQSGRPLVDVVAGPAEWERLPAARVVWPDAYAHSEDPAALDVALLEVTDPGWQPPVTGPVRWGRLTGRSPGVDCDATGFPRVLRDPDNTREADQISGTINPGTGSITGRHDLTVTSAAPATGTDRQISPWSGASGAGVFTNGLLTAVLVIDTKGFNHQRLTAIPSYRILAELGVQQVLESHTVAAVAETVELSEVLISAGREAQLRLRRVRRLSPSMLLRADFEAVEFHGRDDQLSDLNRWCTDPNLEVGVRLLVGPGGRGKTRLARQLVTGVQGQRSPGRHAGRSWVAGFLADRATGRALARVADTAAPVLLVVDYAETRTGQLVELLPRLWAADGGPPVRLLLLARAAGDWWRQLGRNLDDPLGAVTVLPTLDDTVEQRRRAFRAAVDGLSIRLPTLATEPNIINGPAVAAEVPFPEDLAHPRYGDPLSIQLAALLSLLDGRPPEHSAESHGTDGWSGNPEHYLLAQHEEKYWTATAPGWLNLQRDTLAEVVTTATLLGAANRDEALTVLRKLPSLQGQNENAVIATATWLRDLYPAPVGHEWGGLQPDRVGEHLTAATLTQSPRLLASILAPATDAQLYQAVTVLGRALANTTITQGVRTYLATQLSDLYAASEVAPRLAQVTLRVATETADPATLIAALRVVLSKLPDDPLRDLAVRFPEQSLALAGLSADVTLLLVDRLRQKGQQGEDTELDLASWLNNLSLRLSDLGRREDALTAIDEATVLYRQLAAARPDAFTPDLAMSLNNLSAMLSDLGRPEDALTMSEEADAWRQL